MGGKERLIEIIKILKANNILSGLNPKKLVKIIEELGPTYIKIGQILSNRPDLIGEDYIEELSKLRKDTIPMDKNEVLKIIEEELDEEKLSLIEHIDYNPIGSASIAGVYKAVLKNQDRVVIKVQRKNIKEKMTTDIRVLKKAVKVLHLNDIIHNVVSIEEVLDELLNNSYEEMNFLKEADNIIEFAEINKDINYIKVPKVYRNLSTEKVLVMEYIDGINIYDKNKLIKEGYDLVEIGNKLANNYLYQALDGAFFHADPHPDNIFIKEGKIVFLDFGMMGRLNNKNRDLLNKTVYSIINEDIKGVEKNLLTLGTPRGKIDHYKLREELNNILNNYKDTPLEDINISSFIKDVMRLLITYKISLPKDITMLIRGIIVIEGTLEIISPQINLISVIKNRASKEEISNIFNKKNISKDAYKLLKNTKHLLEIPEDIHNALTELNNGETKLNVEISDSSKQIDRLEKMVHRIVVCALDVAFIIGASLIARGEVINSEQKFLFYLYVILATIFTIWLFIKMYIDKLNRKK